MPESPGSDRCGSSSGDARRAARGFVTGKIALFGAAGAIGQSIAAAIRAQGTPYRVVGRSRAALDASFGTDPLAELVTWNPDDPASVRGPPAGSIR